MGLKSYMLVRVALDVGEDSWFGEKLGTREAPPDDWDKRIDVPGKRIAEALPDDGGGRADGTKKRIRGIWKVWGR